MPETPCGLLGGVSYRAQERIFGLTRIQSRMLHDDRNIRLDNACKVGVVRYGFWVGEVVEADMLCSSRRHGYVIRAPGLAIGVENRDCNAGIVIRRIQKANGFVTCELWLGTMAPGWEISLRNRPAFRADRIHSHQPLWDDVRRRSLVRKAPTKRPSDVVTKIGSRFFFSA